MNFKSCWLAFQNSSAHVPDTLLVIKLDISEDFIGLFQLVLIEKGLYMLNLTTNEDHQEFLKLNMNYWTFTGILNYIPGLSNWKEMLHCWKYLKGTQDHGLFLKPDTNEMVKRIQIYTDAKWGEDQETRISQSGSIALWKSFPILWGSKKQRKIILSSTESKLNAFLDGEQENQWVTFLIQELWKLQLDPTLFHVSNGGLLENLKNFGSNSKTKHLDIKIKNLGEMFLKKEIDVKLTSSQNMLANSLSKAAPHSSVKKLQDRCLRVILSSNMEGC
ncbi:hypothetical protein VP01_616g6 [Puccinia sorghi]|uniref:Reverse transcriptase Ty1/copia-type domain-containing protein n=1 Tax=Puccinia sorghi TaxID=27349 RepID=A0A0L6UGV9_9BASI|nr:hypothetical protein VP01_616g6 [Puccinia sorghi]